MGYSFNDCLNLLSDNFHICFSAVSDSVCWFSYCGSYFSAFFECLLLVYWKPVIVIFNLLGAGYFYISLNLALFWETVQLHVNTFLLSGIAFKMFGKIGLVFHLGLIISQY